MHSGALTQKFKAGLQSCKDMSNTVKSIRYTLIRGTLSGFVRGVNKSCLKPLYPLASQIGKNVATTQNRHE